MKSRKKQKLEMMKTTKTLFRTLSDKSRYGTFTYEPNENTEIHVDLCDCKLIVEKYRSSNHFLPTISRTVDFYRNHELLEAAFNQTL